MTQAPQQWPTVPPPRPPRAKIHPGVLIGLVAGGCVLLLCGLLAFTAYVGRAGNGALPAFTPGPTFTGFPTFAAPTTPPAVQLRIPTGLVGGNALIVHDQLERLGFTNVVYGSADPDDTFVVLAQNWTVRKVEPAEGTTLASNQPIVLTCSKK